MIQPRRTRTVDPLLTIWVASTSGNRRQLTSLVFAALPPKLAGDGTAGETRIQLCGRFVVRLDGRRVEDALPGTGQLLFAYLVLNRLRRIDRDELLIAVYGEEAAADHHPRLSVLLSKLRRVSGPSC